MKYNLLIFQLEWRHLTMSGHMDLAYLPIKEA